MNWLGEESKMENKKINSQKIREGIWFAGIMIGSILIVFAGKEVLLGCIVTFSTIFALFILLDFVPRLLQFIIRLLNSLVQVFAENTLFSEPFRYKLLKITKFLFSAKTQKNVFEPTAADWDEEIYEALKENKDANLFMINVRNTYAFVVSMWQKSPLGDLLEYVRKIAN